MSLSELMVQGAVLGAGATVVMDVVALMRQGWTATNGFYCLVGRWIGSLSKIGLVHRDIRQSRPVRAESLLGWGAHVSLGLVFGVGYLVMFGETAVTDPKVWQGALFGALTLVMPWLAFQPLFGWGVAASRLPDPWKLRLRSAITHLIFGLGLWITAVLAGDHLM